MLTFAVIAMLAAAQETTCSRSGVTVVCRQTQDKPLDYGAILQSGRDSVPTYRPSPPIDGNALLRRRVGGLVADGQCLKAEKLAVEAGDFDLAAKVKEYCARQ